MSRETMRQKVAQMILEKKRGSEEVRVFLDRDDFIKFRAEVEPIYKEEYGALIVHMGAADDGYHNILFKGVAVCLGPEHEDQ